MIYRLVILNGDRKGQQVTVPEEPLTIGRGKDCGLYLNDPEVATTHATVTHSSQGLSVMDLGSMGKVLVNNRGVRESTLRHGDIVELGHTRLLVQAVVEAEVRGGGEGGPSRRRQRVRAGLVVVLLTLSLVVLLQWASNRPVGPEIALPGVVAVDPSMPPVGMPEVYEDLAPVAAPGTDVAVVAEVMAVETSAVVVAAIEEPAEPALAVEPLAPPDDIEPVRIPEEPASSQPDPYVLAQAMIDEKVRGMMQEVKQLIAGNRPADADDLLNGVQHLAPDYVDAYVERAWLYEDRGMLDPAVAQWSEVIRLGGDSEIVKTAREKVGRLNRARVEVVPRFAGRVRVRATDQKRFPDSSQVREMRVVSVHLAQGDPAHIPDAKATRVDVLFYDRDLRTDTLRLSRATGKARDLAVPGPWREGEEKVVTATYMVPATTSGGGARAEQYQGFLVRVYYHGALQTIRSEPPGLLARVAPDLRLAASLAEPAAKRKTSPVEP